MKIIGIVPSGNNNYEVQYELDKRTVGKKYATIVDAQSGIKLLQKWEKLEKKENEYFRNGTPNESDQRLNDVQREKIKVFSAFYGVAFLGRINFNDGEEILTAYCGQKIHNFEYAFIIPCKDKILKKMIQARKESPYINVETDLRGIIAIEKRIDELNGIILYWV